MSYHNHSRGSNKGSGFQSDAECMGCKYRDRESALGMAKLMLKHQELKVAIAQEKFDEIRKKMYAEKDTSFLLEGTITKVHPEGLDILKEMAKKKYTVEFVREF